MSRLRVTNTCEQRRAERNEMNHPQSSPHLCERLWRVGSGKRRAPKHAVDMCAQFYCEGGQAVAHEIVRLLEVHLLDLRAQRPSHGRGAGVLQIQIPAQDIDLQAQETVGAGRDSE